jgi:PII-like signaling protein
MENERTVTMVRLYLPEEGHSARKAQMEKVLHLLRDQLHVRGIAVLQGMKDAGSSSEPHYESVGDILRRGPDPPLIIEFFDESPAASEIRRQLRNLAPNSYAVYWQATWDGTAFQRGQSGAEHPRKAAGG